MDKKAYLQFRYVLWPLLNIHPPEPDANSTRRDDDDLVPIFPQLHSRFHNRRQDGEQGLMCLFVYNGAGSWRECQSHAVCKCVYDWLTHRA